MKRRIANPQSRAGFTLVELLVVIGIISALAAMLLPAMFSVIVQTRSSTTEAFIGRIRIALDLYCDTFAHYPPDFIPAGAWVINPRGAMTGSPPSYVKVQLATPAYPPEALYYFLCNGFLSPKHPVLRTRRSGEVADLNGNGLPELVDDWGRPILYNRPPFPGYADSYYNFPSSGACVIPPHNPTKYDLYSVGPDGQTGANDLPAISQLTFIEFCSKAMDNKNDGEGADDIRNWKQ